MRFLLFLAALYMAMIVYGEVAAANDEAPIALQISPWIIGGLKGVQEVSTTPEQCRMQADYDNGLRLTFKATGKKLTALRVESPSNTVNLSKVRGFVGLGINKNSYALQSKYQPNGNGGQIDATLLAVPGVADKLMDAKLLRLKLGVENHYFALQGVDDAYHRLLVCMGIRKTKMLKVVDDSRKTPSVPVVSGYENLPQTMPAEPIHLVDQATLEEGLDQESLAETPDVTISPEAADAAAEAETGTEVVAGNEGAGLAIQDEIGTQETAEIATMPAKQPALPQWRAFKGETLSQALRKWADIAGVKTHIALDSDPVLTKDIVMNGSFEMAVNTLLKAGGGNNTMPSAIVKNADGRVTHVAGYQGAAMIGGAVAGKPTERWRALEGTDLRKVLKRWSMKEGVEFIWDAPESFLIRESVKTTTGYEQAVSLLLGQFSGQSVYPLAQLNTDPDTGKKYLIIKTGRAG